MTQRPKVVVSVSATADGRVALNRTHVLMEKAAGQMWGSLSPPSAREVADLQLAEIEHRYQPGAVLEGSGNFVTDDVGPLTDLPPVDVDPEQLYRTICPLKSLIALHHHTSGSPWSMAEVASDGHTMAAATSTC